MHPSAARGRPPAGHERPFPEELHAVVSRCQVLSAAASTRELPLREIALSLRTALPRPRCSADFLLLRSIVSEFATRAIETTVGGGTDAVIPLVRLTQTDQPLGDVLVACLSAAGAKAADATGAATGEARPARRALSAIAARCAEPDLTAASIACEVGLSTRRLATLLRAHAGGGFRTLLRQARVAAAAALLERSTFSIKEIAARVGYSWTSQFDRDFQRERRMTPGQYRAGRSPSSVPLIASASDT